MPKDVGKILYWTGPIEPHREGISKEVFMLHNNFRGSFVIGTSPDGYFVSSRNQRYFGMPSKLLPTVRYWASLVERHFSFSHIIQGIDNYHYLKAKGSKPVILTAISVEDVLSPETYKRLHIVVVECSRDRKKLLAHGFNPEKVVVVYPGTDLSVFNDTEQPPEGRFKILFASSPFSPEYMEPRGVRLLLEAARIKSEVEFILLWRKRGDTLNLLQRWIDELSLKNVRVVHEDIEHMNRMFVDCHATIVPFTSEKGTKSCPNSAVESLATGRPVLVSDKVGIADVVEAERSGVVFKVEPANLAAAISTMQQDYEAYRKNARACADKHFDEAVFLQSYRQIYASVSMYERGVV